MPKLGLGRTLLKSSGFRAAWTPANITTALWLDADDASTITLNGSTVSQWRDKSGNARHASQATASLQPAYQATGFNNRPAVQFDSDILDIASTALINSGNSNFGIFLAYQTTAKTFGAIFANYPEGNLEAGHNSVEFGYMTPYGIWLNTEVNLSNASYVANELMSVSITRSSGAVTAWTHGVQQNIVANTNSLYGGSNTQSIWRFGDNTIATTVPSEPGKFRLSEFIVINNVVSTDNRQRLEGYLAWKWGLEANLPSGHPYKNSPPTV